MRPRRWLVPLFVACSLGQARGQDAAPKLSPKDRSFQFAVRDAHNAERKRESKPKLVISPLLVETARVQAQDMATRREMSHEGSDGSTVDTRAKRLGYRFLNVGENVAAGHKTIAKVIKDWMGSEGHRANILGDFTEIGAARVTGDDGVMYWVVVFGTPVPNIDVAAAPTALLAELNVERKAKQLAEVRVSSELQTVAQAAAQSLAQSDVAKPALDPKKIYQDAKANGYEYKNINLSLANGVFEAKAVVKALAAAPQSQESVFGDHEHLGVGLAVGDDGITHWVVLLASPLSAEERPASKPSDQPR